MAIFRIYSPTLGKREDFATILLNKAVTPEVSNMQSWNGEMRKAKLRLPELVRTNYEIDSIDSVADTVTLVEGGVTAEFTSGDSVTFYNASGGIANRTVGSSTDVSGQTVVSITGNLSPSTPDDFLFNSDNVPFLSPQSNDFLKVQTPDGYEVIRSEQFITADETERLVAFTKEHVYFWDTVLTNWNLIYTSSADTTEYWDSAEYGDYLVATNNIDRPIQWDGSTATTFEEMDTSYTSGNYIEKAKFIASYRGYVFLGNLTLTDSTELQDSVVTSNIGEGVAAEGFRQDADKDAGFYAVEGSGDIAGGFAEWQGYLIIFKRFSTRKFWFVGGAIPFSEDSSINNVGCSAPGSVVQDSNANLYFYSSVRSLYEISIGRIDKGINVSTRNLNPDLNILIRATFIEEYNEIWWAVPLASDSTANDTIIVFKEPGKWEIRDIPVVTFGQYRNQTGYTWNTLPFATWDDWAWDAWTAVDGSANFPIDLSFDSSGFGYQVHGDYNDDGSKYDSSFVISTDLADKQSLPFKKRINQLFVYVNNERSGTISIDTKSDTETSWQDDEGIAGGTINLFGPDADGNSGQTLRQRIPMDLAAFNYQIRANGRVKFSLIGYELDFEVEGDR